ncbi:MAG: Calx-beta domain-containing protein [Actinomycetota bacterium]
MRRRWILPVLAAAVVFALPILSATAGCHAFSFTETTYTVNEQAESVTLTVERDNNVADSSVKFHTVDGTAKAPQDYSQDSGTLEYTGQDLQKQFQINIVDDASDEQNEVFTVDLDGGSGCGAVNFQYDTATVRILDNDEKPIAQPTPTPTPTPKPTPTKTSTPTPKPSTASASPSPTPSSPSPTATGSPIAAAGPGDGGLSGGALAGIVAATVALGGVAAFWVRRRFLI